MSFEKKMKKRGNDKLNQFAKNPYHQEPVVAETKPQKSFPLWGKILIPTAAFATALVLFVSIGILPMMASNGKIAINGGEEGQHTPAQDAESVNKGNYGSAQENYSYAPGQQSETAPVPHWEEASLIQKYPNFVYGNIQYNIRYSDRSEPISETYVKQKLDDISVRGYDIYEDEAHFINASIYAINSVSDKVSLAIRFEGETAYYAYQNNNYQPQTLSDLLADTCFEDEAIISKGSYMDYIRSDNNKDYAVVDQATIKDILYSDKSPANTNIRTAILKADNPNEQSSSEVASQLPAPNARIDLTIAFPCLGIDDAAITVFINGRMDAVFFGSRATFDVGTNRFTAIKDSLDSNN